MHPTLLVNLILLVAAGLIFNFFTSEIVALRLAQHGNALLFTLSRTTFFALTSLAIVSVPLLLFRRGRKKFTIVPLICLWLLFSITNLIAFVAERMP